MQQGTLTTLRDADDLASIQLATSYFANFVRTSDPNPSSAYLRTRGYNTTLAATQTSGQWQPVTNATGPIRIIDVNATTAVFQELDQCAFLNYSIAYYQDM
jgi:hypothetical protein